MGSFSIWHWLIVLVIVLLIFGTKKLRNIGADLGGAVKGFKDGMKGDEDDEARRRDHRLGHDHRGRGQGKAEELIRGRSAAADPGPHAPSREFRHVRHRILRDSS